MQARSVHRRALLAGLGGLALAPHDATGQARPDVAAAEKLVTAARAQVGVTTLYDAAYVRLAFPNGDVPPQRGVCSDVVVRAYRAAFGYDFQARLNDDMKANFALYPRRWGLAKPDTNIDHRRVLNLEVFLTRRGARLPKPTDPSEWQPGDIVGQTLPNNLPHIGIVDAAKTPDGRRHLVIHNIGRGTEASDILTLFAVTGRYRFIPVA